MPPKSSLANKCVKCSVVVRGAVACAKCGSNYHPACFLGIPGAGVRMDGTVVCCEGRPDVCCQCSVRDDEIVKLKLRLAAVNERCLEKSIAEMEITTVEEAASDCLQREIVEMREYLSGMHSELSVDINELKSALLDLRTALDVHVRRGVDVPQDRDDSGRRGAAVRCGAALASGDVAVGRRRRVLLVADGHGVRCAPLLSGFLGCMFEVCGVVKPDAGLDDVVKDVKSLTRDFDERDFVVVFGGASDVRRDCQLSSNAKDNMYDVSCRTNLVLLSVPFCGGDTAFNGRAFQFNCELYNFTDAEKIANYVECNSLLCGGNINKQGKQITISNKRILMRYISDLITSYITKTVTDVDMNCIRQNLIYIQTSDDTFNLSLPSDGSSFLLTTMTGSPGL